MWKKPIFGYKNNKIENNKEKQKEKPKEKLTEYDFLVIKKHGSLNKFKKDKSFVSDLIIKNIGRHIPLIEKIIKLFILIILRIIIRPSDWKKSAKKNYDLIDNIYEKIMSHNLIYIPSSLAFYIIMAFMPITSLIMFVNSLPFMKDILEYKTSNGVSVNAFDEIFGGFVPGLKDLMSQIKTINLNGNNIGLYITIFSSLSVSTWIASNGLSKMVYTLSHLYGHKYLGGYLMNKLKGISMVLGLTLFLAIALTINVTIVHQINNTHLDSTLKSFLHYIFLAISLVGLLFLAFIGLYRYAPRFKTRVKWIMPGVLASVIPTSFFLIFFGRITTLWSYDRFGAIGSIMYVSMMSLVVTYFIFIGVTVNASYHQAYVGAIEKKWTLSKK